MNAPGSGKGIPFVSITWSRFDGSLSLPRQTLSPSPARADFGLGLFLGEPTGLDLKFGMGNRSALDIVLGYTTFDDARTGYGHVTYLVTPLVGGVVTFFLHPQLGRMENTINVFDAFGLGLFSVAGALKASEHGLGPLPAALLGLVTGVGGGVLRDMLAGRVPTILRKGELYAIPAAAGAGIAVAGSHLDVANAPVIVVASAVTGLSYATFGARRTRRCPGLYVHAERGSFVWSTVSCTSRICPARRAGAVVLCK